MAFDGRAKYVALAALSLLYFLLMACTFNGLGVVLPIMVSDLGWNWAEAGFGFTLLGVACGLSGLVPAMLIRRIGVSRTLLSGGAVLMAGFACFAATRSTIAYDVGAVLLGIGFSLCGTVPGVYVISHSFERRSTAIGIYFTSGGLGSVAGPLLVYAVQAATANWRLYWIVAAILSILLALFAAIVTAARRASAPEVMTPEAIAAADAGWTARRALLTPQFYVIVAAYSTFLLINTTVHSFAVQHIIDLGFSMGSAAGLISGAALIGAAGSALAGVVGEKVPARQLTMISLGALSLGSGALALGGGWMAMILFVLGLGVGLGFSYVSTAMLLLDFFGKRPNLELYSVMCVLSTTAAAGPALGGIARDRLGSFDLVFALCAGVGLLLVLAVFGLRRPELPAAGEEATPFVPQYG